MLATVLEDKLMTVLLLSLIVLSMNVSSKWARGAILGVSAVVAVLSFVILMKHFGSW